MLASRRPWTEAEDQKLKQLLADKSLTKKQIAYALHRNRHVMHERMKTLGLVPEHGLACVLAVRVTREMLERIRVEAESDGVAMRDWVRALVARELEGRTRANTNPSDPSSPSP